MRLALVPHLRRNAAVVGAPDVPVPPRIEIQPRNLTGRDNRLDGPIDMARHQPGRRHQVVEGPRGGITMRMHAPGASQPTPQAPGAQQGEEIIALMAGEHVHDGGR